MIVFKDRSWQQMSGHPDDNYLAAYNCEQPQWVVDDNSELSERIKHTPHWEPIEDSEGKLIDVVPIEFESVEEEPKPSVEQLQADILYLSMMTGIDLS